MGFFSDTYRVEYNDGILFENWITVLKNVSRKEADEYVNSKTGLFGESKSKYQIVKE